MIQHERLCRASNRETCTSLVPRMFPETGKRPSKGPLTCGYVVGDTGFEPVTSSVSGKRATAAPIARDPEGSRSAEADFRGRDGI